MLWFDNDPKAEIDAKIRRAADYYHNKYGVTPNLCFIHPTMLPNTAQAGDGPPQGRDEKLRSGNIEVRTSRSVLPNHFWIGVNGTVN
jgi:hypothetical protein